MHSLIRIQYRFYSFRRRNTLLKHFAALTTVTLSSKPDRQGCGRKLNGNAWLGWWGSHDLDQK